MCAFLWETGEYDEMIRIHSQKSPTKARTFVATFTKAWQQPVAPYAVMAKVSPSMPMLYQHPSLDMPQNFY
jgi:hypothetical protein